MASTTRNRRTIGYLTTVVSGDNGQSIAFGVFDAARELELNVLCFAGRCLSDPRGFEARANALFDLPSAESVDGIVTWASMIGAYVGAAENRRFHERYRPLPTVVLGVEVEGLVGILIDGFAAMRAAAEHLIVVHGRRRIAFIRGPENHAQGQERYRAYLEALKAHSLPVDPRLVSPPMHFEEESGAEAMRLLLDGRKLRPPADFDAVIAASDTLMLGALEVMQGRGIDVPGSAAVLGFDNRLQGQTSNPTLTSVAPPFEAMGRRGVAMLSDLLSRAPVSGVRLVPRLVVRQSCGCPDAATLDAKVEIEAVVPADATVDVFSGARAQALCYAMARAAGDPRAEADWAGRLVERFASELQGETPGGFMQALNAELSRVMAHEGDVSAWQGVISTLRRETIAHLEAAALGRAEDLWHQARVAVSQAATWAQARRAFAAARHVQSMRQVEVALLTAVDVAGITDELARGLPQLGIPSCFLALYEDGDCEWSRLRLAFTEKGRIGLGPSGQRFRSREVLPRGMEPGDRPYAFIIESLFFQDQQLGYVMLEVGPRDGRTYDVLGAQISGALKRALLAEERAKAEEDLGRERNLLRTVIDTLPDFVYVKDLDGRYVLDNVAHLRSLGAASPESIVGKTAYDFFPREMAEEYSADEREVMRTGAPLVQKEERTFDYPSGFTFWHSTTKVARRDSDGRIVGLVGISRDVTKNRHTAEELRQAKELAEAATRAKSEFLANMSHEIRTPMNAIVGLVHLLLRTAATPTQRDYLNKIHSSAQTLLGLLKDVLDLSRIEAGKLEMESTVFRLEQVLQSVANVVALRAQEKGLAVFFRIAPGVPVDLTGDPLRVVQVLTNLVGNAVKFTEEGGIVVAAELESAQGASVRLRFSVRDTGIGMSEEQVAKLFRPFTQADGSTTRRYGGSGLGLAISRSLVEKMGGAIAVESSPGSGSTFRFTVALSATADAARARGWGDGLRGKRALVVGANPFAREVLGSMLQSASLEVATAPSCPAGLSELQRMPCDLVILDWNRSDLDGIAMVKWIKALATPVPSRLILTTVAGRVEETPGAADLGVDGFLIEPVQEWVLQETIRRAFDREPAQPQQEAIPQPGTPSAIAGCRVLVVEDNEINRQVAQELLQGFGLSVSFAHTGKAAVDLLAAGGAGFDAILMDVQTPEMDGVEATRAIRTTLNDRKTPIIAITAHVMQGERQRCLDAGMNDYLSKPIDPDGLYETLARWIQIGSGRRPAGGPPGDLAVAELAATMPGLDARGALRRVNGNLELLVRMLRDFARENEGTAGRIGDALACGDAALARHLVHAVKGTAGNLGLTSVHAGAERVESALGAGDRSATTAAVRDLSELLANGVAAAARLKGGEREPARAPGAAPLPAARLAEMLADLDGLLQKNSLGARSRWAQLKEQIGGDASVPASVAALDQALTRLDFASARQRLAEVARDLA